MATEGFGEITQIGSSQIKQRAFPRPLAFPEEPRAESCAQGLELLQIAHPEIKPRLQFGDPMHEEHQVDANWQIP